MLIKNYRKYTISHTLDILFLPKMLQRAMEWYQ